MAWTEEEDAELKRLTEQRLSASQIARGLRAEFKRPFTRNSVIGRLQRRPELGKLLGQKANQHASRKPKPAPKQRMAPVIVSAPPSMPVNAPDDDLAIPAKQRRTLMQLKAQQCHWPVGDPSATGFFFCGAVVEPGYLYCPAHCARAYRTPSQFREERKQVQRKAA